MPAATDHIRDAVSDGEDVRAVGTDQLAFRDVHLRERRKEREESIVNFGEPASTPTSDQDRPPPATPDEDSSTPLHPAWDR